MREILFRGKRVDNGEWVEGNLFIPDRPETPTQICIGTNIIRITYDVIPETVGQYTGLTDKNGKKIFEGDIVKNEYEKGKYQYFKVLYCNRLYMWQVANKYEMLANLYNLIGKIEIIGNIHDNPELLKGE